MVCKKKDLLRYLILFSELDPSFRTELTNSLVATTSFLTINNELREGGRASKLSPELIASVVLIENKFGVGPSLCIIHLFDLGAEGTVASGVNDSGVWFHNRRSIKKGQDNPAQYIVSLFD